MIKQEIEIDYDIAEALEDGFRRFPSVLDRTLRRNISRAKSRILGRLRQEPGPVQYPIRWTSERQRRKVMALLKGKPYRRTHRLVEGWKIDLDRQTTTGIITVFNPSDIEQYVTGIHQQGFHQDTGWYRSQDVLADAMVEIEDIVMDTYIAVTEDIFQ